MKAVMRKIAFVALLALSAMFYYAYYTSHYKWRDCFNALGRCFDSESGVVYMAQLGGVLLSMAVITSVLALYQLLKLIR
jgi:hypothetical protein